MEKSIKSSIKLRLLNIPATSRWFPGFPLGVVCAQFWR
jgi:hypothetical protein